MVLRLVSWNIQCGKGVDGRFDLGRIVDTAMRLADADVLCFQEVAVNFPSLDGGAGEDQPARLGALLPQHRVVFRPAVDMYGTPPGDQHRGFGNVILSRLPVLQVFNHLLPRPAERGGHSMQRHALEIVVAAPFGPLRIVATHLEYYSSAHRVAQVERLRWLHQEASQRAHRPDRPDEDDGPYRIVPRPPSSVLCGDFNVEPTDPLYAALVAPFADGVTPAWRDAWTVARPAGTPHDPTCGIADKEQWPDGPHCRDFFFVTEDMAPRVVAVAVDTATTASDHQPIALTLAI
jgi:endonuclease/exonuclease/phosphatase family metal-dependent hydrolase